ncbi:MAG: 8-amino-7-oxononanoate synthase [Verrucomicrobia bacterium]|nr:8-amino-7-oxononanoate synthase [Verrucomicrobiota bacterium]
MNDFENELNRQLAALREQHLLRKPRRVDSPQAAHLEIDGRRLLNFSSNDYLGLANDPEIKQAAIDTVARFGAGTGASPLICGRLAPHAELEEALAAFKGTPAALCFSSGYAAALGAIGALMGRGDFIVIDKLVHASIVDAARLCGAKLRVFAHSDLESLTEILRWIDRQRSPVAPGTSVRRPRTLIVTESIFSMDGDRAPLRELVELKEKFGVWLMVDEAHATGIYGAARRGLIEECGLDGHVEIEMGTLSKALGASGGYICGSRALIDLLVNRARSYIFSTAPAPAAVGAATAAIRVVQSAVGAARRKRLKERIEQLAAHAGAHWRSAIVPILIGAEGRALTAAAELQSHGIFVPAIRYPTVARGAARLRVTLTAAHDRSDLEKLIEALAELLPTRAALPE